MDAVKEEQIRQTRRANLMDIVSRVAYLLQPADKKCVVESAFTNELGPGPCWSWFDPATRTFQIRYSMQICGKGAVDTPRGIVRLLGYGYHEIGHVLFTPDNNLSALRHVTNKHTVDPTYRSAFNILEDGRIERLMLRHYAAILPYLTLAICNLFPVTPQNPLSLTSIFFLAGRRNYLPTDYLAASLSQCTLSQKDIKELFAVTAEYNRLAWKNKDREHNKATDAKAEALIERFVQLWATGAPNEAPKAACGSSFAEANADASRKASSDGHAAHGTGTVVELDDLDGTGTPQDDDTDANGADLDELLRLTGSKTADQHTLAGALARTKGIESAVKNINGDGAVETVQQNQIVPKSALLPVKSLGTARVSISRNAKMQRDRIVEKFYNLIAEQGDELRTYQNRGTFNATRWMSSAMNPTAVLDPALTGMYDQYVTDTGDSLSFAVSLLLDFSTSMTQRIDSVLQGAWAIASAIRSLSDTHNIQSELRVTTFGSAGSALPRFGEEDKTLPRISRGGDRILPHTLEPYTYVSSALVAAEHHMQHTTCTHKLVVILTDGAFSDRDIAEPLLKDIRNKAGAAIVLAEIAIGSSLDDALFDLRVKTSTGEEMLEALPAAFQTVTARMAHQRQAAL